MISRGSPEHRHYWTAWYRLQLPPSERRPMHLRLSLPESHTTWGPLELKTWEDYCTSDPRRRLMLEIRYTALRLYPDPAARPIASGEIRAALGIEPRAELEELTGEQLHAILAMLQQREPAPAPAPDSPPA